MTLTPDFCTDAQRASLRPVLGTVKKRSLEQKILDSGEFESAGSDSDEDVIEPMKKKLK